MPPSPSFGGFHRQTEETIALDKGGHDNFVHVFQTNVGYEIILGETFAGSGVGVENSTGTYVLRVVVVKPSVL
jgi:hypothetical protein